MNPVSTLIPRYIVQIRFHRYGVDTFTRGHRMHLGWILLAVCGTPGDGVSLANRSAYDAYISPSAWWTEEETSCATTNDHQRCAN